MFGYIIVNKQELKFREFDVYQSYYCGLCQSLKERFGRRGQLTLSYDMTFVALLLSALYDEPVENSTCKCVAHPFEAHATSRSVFTDYAADMNLLLSYYKCLDDWTDERKWKASYVRDGRSVTKAAPRNCVCESQPSFCSTSAVPKMGNTYSIPPFLKL